MQYAERFSETYLTVICCMGINCQESILDRLIRASLRFNIPWEIWWTLSRAVERHRLSTETYAELLCVDGYDSSKDEIVNLVKAQFVEPPDKRLRLQPIVWAHLLQSLLPFTLESGLIPLFLMIPPYYWHADYEPPPLFPKNDMKIRSISDEYHRAVSFNKAFYDYLYPAIADALCEGFTHVEDSLFHPDPAADGFPAPQDPRLLALLTLAGSPSIQKTAINRSMEELFTHVLRNIATYMGLPGNLLNHETPPFKLDSNLYAVLKLLYMLVSSDDFGTTLLVDHQRITLMLFLRVLNATTPRHCFLSSNWCTPTMASKFTQIAFVPPDWTLSSSTRTLQFVYDFLQLGGPIANQVFSRFVSGRLLDHVVKLRGNKISDSRLRLQEILGAFISRMTSDLEIFDRSKAYLFELDNIFAVCAMYIIWRDIPRLRLLVQCCPDHPVWTECLWKLDTIPEHFELWLHHREEILSTVSDFRLLFEGGEPPIFTSQSTVSSLWRRLRRRPGNIRKELTRTSKV